MVRQILKKRSPRQVEQRLPSAVYRAARQTEGLPLALLDYGAAVGAWSLAILTALIASTDKTPSPHLVWMIALAGLAQLVGHRLAGMYGPMWQYASVVEATRVVIGVLGGALLATISLAISGMSVGTDIPLLQAPPLASLLVLLGCGGIRFQARLFAVERIATIDDSGLRTVIVGVGPSGAALAHELTTTEAGRNVNVIGFVDVGDGLAGRSIRGMPILGTIDQLEEICVGQRIDRVLITTSTDQPEVRSILSRALASEAQVKVLPSNGERVHGPLVRSLRDLDVTDLLGREVAPVDSTEIGEYLAGSTILVTGAGGSIGSEIADQVASYKPDRLVVLDRDETLLHDLVTGPLSDAGCPIEPVLADVCDEVRMQNLFDRWRPDVVFHAAAQKHVPILERYPAEAVRINVLGTLTVAQLAARRGCRMVHISTDKAADPVSVMGATKRAAEQLVFEIGRRHEVPFVAVRFGNVLASRGSVVPTFLRQILEGGPVTVTSAEMTRYFMTIPEAVSLVLQSGAMADDSRIYLLDMGEPVPILSLAHQMIRLAGLRPGEDIDIEIVGVRPGERLHERLSDDAEVVGRSAHPSISALDPKATWDWDELMKRMSGLRKVVERRDDDQVRGQLEDLLQAGGVECSLEFDSIEA